MALLWSLIWQHRVEKLLLTRPKLLLQQVFNWHQIPAYFCSSQIILFLLSPNNSPFRGHFTLLFLQCLFLRRKSALPHQLLLKGHGGWRMWRTGELGICPFQKVMDCPWLIQELLDAHWQPRPLSSRASKMDHGHEQTTLFFSVFFRANVPSTWLSFLPSREREAAFPDYTHDFALFIPQCLSDQTLCHPSSIQRHRFR